MSDNPCQQTMSAEIYGHFSSIWFTQDFWSKFGTYEQFVGLLFPLPPKTGESSGVAEALSQMHFVMANS